MQPGLEKTGFVRIDTVVIAVKQILVNHTKPDLPTLIFLHEGLGSIGQWKDFPNLLCEATGLNAIIYDRQGYGKSAPFEQKRAKDYLHIEAHKVLPEVIIKLKIKNPILVGHSDGGTIALLYASVYKPFAIICLAAHVLTEEFCVKGIREAFFQKDSLIEKLRKYHGDKTEPMFSAWADSWLNPEFWDWNIEAELPAISCPALLLQGENDEYATPSHLEIIKNGIGDNAKSVLIRNAGHIPHLDAKNETLRFIADFIDKLSQN